MNKPNKQNLCGLPLSEQFIKSINVFSKQVEDMITKNKKPIMKKTHQSLMLNYTKRVKLSRDLKVTLCVMAMIDLCDDKQENQITIELSDYEKVKYRGEKVDYKRFNEIKKLELELGWDIQDELDLEFEKIEKDKNFLSNINIQTAKMNFHVNEIK
jgi:hypothetical protein